MTLKPGAWVDPEKMTAAIHDAGFTPVPEDVHLTLTGTLEARQGRVVLVLSDMTSPRELVCAAAPDHQAISSAIDGQVGRKVEIRGRWRFDAPGSVEVESIAPAAPGP